jgi:hypothetical protein
MYGLENHAPWGTGGVTPPQFMKKNSALHFWTAGGGVHFILHWVFVAY